MRRPTWKHEVNLNTILLALGLMIMGAGWGMTWQESKSDQKVSAAAIERLDTRMGEMSATMRAALAEIQGQMKTYADLPYRVAALESQSTNAFRAQRELEQAMTQLSSDLRVTREIIERMDQPRVR